MILEAKLQAAAGRATIRLLKNRLGEGPDSGAPSTAWHGSMSKNSDRRATLRYDRFGELA